MDIYKRNKDSGTSCNLSTEYTFLQLSLPVRSMSGMDDALLDDDTSGSALDGGVA